MRRHAPRKRDEACRVEPLHLTDLVRREVHDPDRRVDRWRIDAATRDVRRRRGVEQPARVVAPRDARGALVLQTDDLRLRSGEEIEDPQVVLRPVRPGVAVPVREPSAIGRDGGERSVERGEGLGLALEPQSERERARVRDDEAELDARGRHGRRRRGRRRGAAGRDGDGRCWRRRRWCRGRRGSRGARGGHEDEREDPEPSHGASVARLVRSAPPRAKDCHRDETSRNWYSLCMVTIADVGMSGQPDRDANERKTARRSADVFLWAAVVQTRKGA